MAGKWKYTSGDSPGDQHVYLNGEKLPVTELGLSVGVNAMPQLDLKVIPLHMDVDLRNALVRVLPQRQYIQYKHHGRDVWVNLGLQQLHRAYCLCWRCKKFKPGEEDNCPIAQDTYENCVKHGTVTPMWECPEFEEE